MARKNKTETMIQGLSNSKYQVLLSAVKAGRLTWEQAEAAGACEPKATTRRVADNLLKHFPMLKGVAS